MPDNLPELRDIHLPDGVSMWPPAYGWWLIPAMLFGAWGMVHLFRFLRLKSKKIYAQKLLKDVSLTSRQAAAAKMSEILRRICVLKYPEALCLSGQEWVAFLASHTKEKLSKNVAELLKNAPYMPEKSLEKAEDDVKALQEFCRRWIGENL